MLPAEAVTDSRLFPRLKQTGEPCPPNFAEAATAPFTAVPAHSVSEQKHHSPSAGENTWHEKSRAKERRLIENSCHGAGETAERLRASVLAEEGPGVHFLASTW